MTASVDQAFNAEHAYRTNLCEIPPRSSLRYSGRFSKASLDAWRCAGDPPADAVASLLHERHGGLTKIHDLLTTVREKAHTLEGCDGAPFRDFLALTAQKPAWADSSMIERGQRVHATLLPFMGLSLFSGSLVGGAQFSIAAAVTALAGNITSNPTRRIDETGALLAAIAFPGSLFEAGAEAHDSLTRVRLLHSALRHWLPRSGRLRNLQTMVPEQVYVEGEVPINQEDLAITLGVFCYINIRSLRRMGVVLSSRDVHCYVHMWRYAGFVLGIEDGLLPATIEDQEEFMMSSMLHSGAPDSIDGPKVKEFIDAFAQRFSRQSWGLVPVTVMQTFLYQMTRHLNGNDYTTGMGIDDLGDWHWTVLLMKSLGFAFGTVLPRMPLGESLMFRWHTSQLRRALERHAALHGPATGHGAGSGTQISIQSKL